MRAKVISILSVLALLWACAAEPPVTLLQPSVTHLKVEATYDSVSLEATLENAENITSAGFYLWSRDGEKIRKVCRPEDKRITASFSGLSPSTSYQYAVFLSNGKQEVLTQTQYFTTGRMPMPELIETQVVPTAIGATVTTRFTNASFLRSCELFFWEGNSSSRTRVSSEISGDVATFRISGLTPETEYRFSVFYENGYETVETEPQVFKTTHPEFEPGLLKYLLENFDRNADGAMSQTELEDITEIVLSDIYLESLNGLESLVNLKSLSMGNNWLKTIDLSANKKLEFFSGGRDTHWEQLIIDNPELFYLYLIEADNLKTIDLTHCPKLSNFDCYGVKLEAIDFSHNEKLYALFIHNTNLKELDLSSNWNLKHLGSHDNPLLETIWLKAGIIMTNLDIDSNTQVKYK